MSLYERLKAAGVPLDNHESDLYALATPEAVRILATHPDTHHTRTFVSQLDGQLWLDIPFAYTPWWEARARRPEAQL
jgi:hypothetical protein